MTFNYTLSYGQLTFVSNCID